MRVIFLIIKMSGKKAKKNNGGFSLLELIVALAVFTVAITIGAGIVLSVLAAQSKAINVQVVEDNMAFALESMSKEIRTGKSYHCGADNSDYDSFPQSCPPNSPPQPGDGGQSFTFINAVGDTVMYRVLGGQLEKTSDGVSFLPITSPEVNIERITFYVYGAEPSDNFQPMVIISMSAKVGEKFVSEINLQTTITQRMIDF